MLRYLQQARANNSRTDAAFRTLASTVGGRRFKSSAKAGKAPTRSVNTNIIKLANLALYMNDLTDSADIQELLKQCTEGSNHAHLNMLGKKLDTISNRENRPINLEDLDAIKTRVESKSITIFWKI